jgi:hypothetical protein
MIVSMAEMFRRPRERLDSFYASKEEIPMKHLTVTSTVFVLVFILTTAAGLSAQDTPEPCAFNIVGTWQSTTGGHKNPALLRFAADGTATVLTHAGSGAGLRPAERSRFKLDNAKYPKAISLTPIKDGADTDDQTTTMEITQYDDGAFTTAVTVTPDAELTRWTRVDQYRYFVVLAAGKGSPGFGAPAFATLIKTDGQQTVTDAFGLYPAKDGNVDYPKMGEISADLRKKFDTDPRDDSAALLRLEVTAGPYQRALKILKTWERRVRDNALLYNIPYLDNAVYLNQLATSLNGCAETIKLEKLTWRIDDPIISKQNLPQVPYFFIKDIRERNKDLHLGDDKFHQKLQAANLRPLQ